MAAAGVGSVCLWVPRRGSLVYRAGRNPHPAIFEQSDIRQVIETLWASVSPSVQWLSLFLFYGLHYVPDTSYMLMYINSKTTKVGIVSMSPSSLGCEDKTNHIKAMHVTE